MPNQNGTGPDGKGPKTGRGRGKCRPRQRAEAEVPARPARGARGGERRLWQEFLNNDKGHGTKRLLPEQAPQEPRADQKRK